MTPATIIRTAQADGVCLSLSPTGTIKAVGEGAAVNRWLAVIRKHKVDIIEVLKVGDPLAVVFAPAEDHAAALAYYPDALSPELQAERLQSTQSATGAKETTVLGLVDLPGDSSGNGAEAIAWHEDDRRRCAHCLNIRPGGICKVAEPGGLVSAVKGYRPNRAVLQRCAGYRPCPDDPDQRPGRERWPGL